MCQYAYAHLHHSHLCNCIVFHLVTYEKLFHMTAKLKVMANIYSCILLLLGLQMYYYAHAYILNFWTRAINQSDMCQ